MTGRGDYYVCLFDLSDPLILNTSGATNVRNKDIRLLKAAMRERGTHYSINNIRI